MLATIQWYYLFKIIIAPVIPYLCETWSLTLREEHRLRVFENRLLRRIFGPERWSDGRLELRKLYLSPSIIRTIKSARMRWAGHVARIGRGGEEEEEKKEECI
jgi:hypothetical protein